jgi:hypothetical protein
MTRRGGVKACLTAVGILLAAISWTATVAQDDLQRGFVRAPDSARPWVYWFWLNGNITREGVTADLEAMQRVGIGGVLIMEVDQGAPLGPVSFAGPEWRDLFSHVVAEADRLGLEVNMNNDAGWCGSGGPWITPDLAMQKVVWTETEVQGPTSFDGVLPEPPKVAGYYRDVAVLAFPTPSDYRIEDIEGKSSLVRREFAPRAASPDAPPGAAIPHDRIVNLTANMDKDGRLSWDVPAGAWTVVRLGHTSTGAVNRPSPASGLGLECDKLSKEGAEAAFAGLMGKLIADNSALAGKTLVATHIDSWEVGSQNWTPGFREEFQRLRGYDLLPYLPAMTGRVVDSLEVSERFLWDLRQTISDLLVENYAGRFRELAHRHRMRLTVEAYGDGPYADMAYAARADEPMAEFWSWPNNATSWSCTEMSSGAHTYGKRILGAEAFTATDGENWLHHPASIKALGDWAFCEGINRFVFHRYAMQPWLTVEPGMSMGPWGLHYERTQTWWEQSRPWHEYLARCQYMLQQGLWVADICFLQPEGSPQTFRLPAGRSLDRGGYNYDGCTPEVVLTRMQVKDGGLVLPDGMSYRLLVLPDTPTMTPGLLRKIRDLVAAGATVLGNPPVKSPSLSGYPACDAEVQALAAELWGDAASASVGERRLGKGKVIWGRMPEEVLAAQGVPPDFDFRTGSSAPVLRYAHRTIGDADVYFVASCSPNAEEAVCAFRVQGKRPELWWPETGRVEKPAVYDESGGVVRIPIWFAPTESVFVVFRPGGPEQGRITSVALDGRPLLDTAWKPAEQPAPDNNGGVVNTFTMTAWVKPDAEIGLPEEANTGASGQAVARNEVVYPAPGHEVYAERGQAGAGFSVGRNGVCVCEHSANYFAPVLVYAGEITDWTHVAVVYRDARPSLYLNGKLVRTGLQSRYSVHSSIGVRHGRTVESFRGEAGALQQFARALREEEIRALMGSTPLPPPREDLPAVHLVRGQAGALEAEVWKAGTYALTTADGKVRTFSVGPLPEPVEIAGPWELRFPPGGGAPEHVMLDKLISWSEHDDPGVRYFSGTATYLMTFSVPANLVGPGRRLYLDLGRVQLMARVKLNGRDLGVLWKPPYRVEVTGVVRPGENALELDVVNLWPNRMIGDEELPEDSARNPDGTLKKWPQWLLDGERSPTGRYTFTSWRRWQKGSPLLESGLLGPVLMRPAATVTLAPPSRSSVPPCPMLPQESQVEHNIEDYATIEAYVGKDETPVYAFGYTYVYGVSPDLLPGVVMQQGNGNPVRKFTPKKSWEISDNLCGSTPAREPKTMCNDDQPLLPIHLIDGDPETAWSSRGGTVPDRQPEWIRIDLPTETEVSAVALVCCEVGPCRDTSRRIGKALPGDLTVKLSRDAREWETVYETKELTGPDSGPTVVAFSPRRAKQIWVIAENLPNKAADFGHVISIGSLEVRSPTGENLALVSKGAGVQVSSTHYGYGMDRFTQATLWPIQYDLGFKWLRVGYDMSVYLWSYVEREKGKLQVDAEADKCITDAVRNGMNVILCLDKGNWLYHDPPRKVDWKKARVREMMETYYDHQGWPSDSPELLKGYLAYVDYMVRHFKGRVAYYEICNEWEEIGIDKYMSIVEATIPVIRKADPEAKIMLGSTSAFDRGLILDCLRRLDLAKRVDAIGWHPFYQVDPAEPHYLSYGDDVQEFKEECEELGFRGAYAATEWTWAAPYPHFEAGAEPSRDFPCSEMQKAKYCAQLMTTHCGLDVISLYNETFQTGKVDWDCTLLRNAFSVDPISPAQPQPVYYVLRSISTVLDGFRAAEVGVVFSPERRLDSCTFRRGDGEIMVAAWIPGRTSDGVVEVKTDLLLPGLAAKKAVVIDVFNGTEQELEMKQTDDGVVLANMLIKDYPTFVRLSL